MPNLSGAEYDTASVPVGTEYTFLRGGALITPSSDEVAIEAVGSGLREGAHQVAANDR
jgi:hypothetical protein